MRVLELQTEQGNRVAASTVKRLVGERNHRLEEWQTRWDQVRDALDAILIERGEELGNWVGEDGGAFWNCRPSRGTASRPATSVAKSLDAARRSADAASASGQTRSHSCAVPDHMSIQ